MPVVEGMMSTPSSKVQKRYKVFEKHPGDGYWAVKSNALVFGKYMCYETVPSGKVELRFEFVDGSAFDYSQFGWEALDWIKANMNQGDCYVMEVQNTSEIRRILYNVTESKFYKFGDKFNSNDKKENND